MKCQILFSEKNKKNVTNLLSAELAQRVVKANLNHYFSLLTTNTTVGITETNWGKTNFFLYTMYTYVKKCSGATALLESAEGRE